LINPGHETMAELADYAEDEPDMESDPTLASCCRREIKDRRVKQGKLDAIRAGMPATVRAAPAPARRRNPAWPAPRCAGMLTQRVPRSPACSSSTSRSSPRARSPKGRRSRPVRSATP